MRCPNHSCRNLSCYEIISYRCQRQFLCLFSLILLSFNPDGFTQQRQRTIVCGRYSRDNCFCAVRTRRKVHDQFLLIWNERSRKQLTMERLRFGHSFPFRGLDVIVWWFYMFQSCVAASYSHAEAKYFTTSCFRNYFSCTLAKDWLGKTRDSFIKRRCCMVGPPAVALKCVFW